MNDYIYKHSSPQSLLTDCLAFLKRDQDKMRHLNVKWTDEHAVESPWLYNAAIFQQGDDCVIYSVDNQFDDVRIPISRLKQLKIRPYYFAACVGFKNIVFYVDHI